MLNGETRVRAAVVGLYTVVHDKEGHSECTREREREGEGGREVGSGKKGLDG